MLPTGSNTMQVGQAPALKPFDQIWLPVGESLARKEPPLGALNKGPPRLIDPLNEPAKTMLPLASIATASPLSAYGPPKLLAQVLVFAGGVGLFTVTVRMAELA